MCSPLVMLHEVAAPPVLVDVIEMAVLERVRATVRNIGYFILNCDGDGGQSLPAELDA